MLDLDKLLGQLLGSSQAKSLAGGLLVGGLAGAMTGKTGKKVATTALKLGGAAAVAGLAYKAYQHYRASQGQANAKWPPGITQTPFSTAGTAVQAEADERELAPPLDSGFMPPPGDKVSAEALSSKLISAMISVAKADGRIDAGESGRIFRRVESLGFTDEERHFLLSAVSNPWTVEQVAAAAGSREEAADIYAASVLAAKPGGVEEEAHLSKLEKLLNLDPGLAQAIRNSVRAEASLQ